MVKKTEKVTRKLRAILSADVKGYSLLMADDEVHTIQTLKTYQKLILDLISQHSGRVVDNPGDNLLAEFGSAVDAVEAAVQIQNKLKKENATFVENKRMQFRIGVNIGDVVHDGDRIYGEGVNIAARIESLADAGGICISRNTYDHIKNKLNIDAEYLGEHQVKNVEEPVRVYKILMDTESPKPLVEEDLELPDKPSIAVLPFTNMSGDSSQEYFSDGLTAAIINSLCKNSNLFVIARNSSFAFKGKSASVKQIAKELGVRYILEGGVQRAGSRVRITAQLIDAATDFHMWSEKYDRDLEDIFTLQDEIVMELGGAMAIQLTHGDQARLWTGSQTNNIRAYDKFVLAFERLSKLTRQDIAQSISFFEEAISLDKDYALAYACLGFSHVYQVLYGWSQDPIVSIEQAERCAEKALGLDDKLDVTHLLLANLCLVKRQHDDAIEECKRALDLNANSAEAYTHLASIYNLCGQPGEAIKLKKISFRLNPIPPGYYFTTFGYSYVMLGEYKDAIRMATECIRIAPDSLEPYLQLAYSYISLGNTLEANEAVQKLLSINPTWSLDKLRLYPFKNESDLQSLIEHLRKAGLPEHSPE